MRKLNRPTAWGWTAVLVLSAVAGGMAVAGCHEAGRTGVVTVEPTSVRETVASSESAPSPQPASASAAPAVRAAPAAPATPAAQAPPVREALGQTPGDDASAVSTPSDEAPAFAPAPTVPTEAIAPVPAPEFLLLNQREDRVVKVLPNRMVLVAQRLPIAPVVSAQVWVKTGSLYEQEHVGAGLSHFLEHLLSGGTTSTHPESESTATLGAIGAQTNAATSLDTVRYYINTTSGNTDEAVALLSDWMQHNVVLESEYARERDVIQREFSMGLGDPGRIFWKLTQRARFAATPNHPGAHPTIGYLDRFLSISRDEIYDFYRRMYVPNNMVFVVVGDIDPQETIEQLTALWGGQKPGVLPALSFPVEPEEASVVTVQGYADITRPRARLLWRGVKLGAEHDYALDLLASVLGQGESSRLVRSLRNGRGAVTSIDAFNYSTTWGEGFFGIDFEPAEGVSVDEAADLALAELAKMLREPVTAAELARAKRKVLASALGSGQSAQAVAGRLASDIIGTGDPDYLRRYADAVQSLTPEDLMAAARAVVPPAEASRVVMLPADEAYPVTTFAPPDESPEHARADTAAKAVGHGTDDASDTSDAADADAGAAADTAAVVPFDLDNRGLIARLEATLADPASEARAVTVDAPVVTTLDNGLTLIVQRNTVVPAVAMQLYTLGGLLAETPGQEGLGNAQQALLNRGAGGMTAAQIAAALEDLGADLSAGEGNNTGYVHTSALAEDWPAVMAIMADVVLRPEFPEGEWSKLQPRLLAAIDRQDDRWSGELRRVFRETYFGDHPWSQTTLGRRGVIASATAEQLREAYMDRLNAADTVLAVVGDVDPARVRAEVEKRFGAMPTRGGKFVPPMPAVAEAQVQVVPTAKPVTAVEIGYGPGITRDDPDYAALAVLARLVSDFPAGWLEQALRGEGPGLVYAVSGGSVTGLVPGYFAVIFNTQADTAAEATRRAAAVIERARTELASDTELARAKAKVLSSEFLSQQSNASLATKAALDYLYNVHDPAGRRLVEEVNALTAEQLREVAQRYLHHPVAVVLTNGDLDPAVIEAALREGSVGDAGSQAAVPSTPAE